MILVYQKMLLFYEFHPFLLNFWAKRPVLQTVRFRGISSTIILKCVAKQCIYEPTLCCFESLVTKSYTIHVYGTFHIKCVVFQARGSSSTWFFRAQGFNSTYFCQARGFNSTCSCWDRSSPTRTFAIKTLSPTKTSDIRTSSLKNNTFFAKNRHKSKLCKILRPNF